MHLYKLRKVSYTYGGPPVLTIDRWSMQGDCVTGVVGPNGSGKSTLLGLLGFAFKPTTGEIQFRGCPCAPFDDRVRAKVVTLTQNAYLLKRSVYNNVAYGLRINKRKFNERDCVYQALEMVGLDPNIFGSRPWYALSGGEYRRVALAARLALKPEVLLMDEPTTSVDAVSAQMIKEATLYARKQWGTTLVITSHDREWLADVADRIVHLFRGRILGEENQTLIFGPWQQLSNDTIGKKLADGQLFQAYAMPTDQTTAVAALEAKQVKLYSEALHIPEDSYRLKGVLLRLNYERSIDRICAAVSVGSVVFSAYLNTTQVQNHRFSPGQAVWMSYDARAVKWY